MNIKLLRRIQKQILKEPKQFHMKEWFSVWLPWHIPNCNTAACIGGWAIAISEGDNPEVAQSKFYTARGTTDPEDYLKLSTVQAERLFHEACWPKRFRGGRGALTRARRAVARIDAFIKSKGKI